MVIEFDFEIYKNGDYDKVYLRNGKEARVLCDNGKGNSPMVVMIEDDKADDYIILRYNETGRRNINGQSGLDLMLSVKEREPELWVVVISYMDNKDKRQKMVLPNFFSRNKSWATTRLAVVSFTSSPRKMIRSFNNLE